MSRSKLWVPLLLLLPVTSGLTYSLGKATQCGDLEVEWQDNVGDMEMVVLPTDHGTGKVVQTFKIPGSETSPYTLKNFKLPSGSSFVAALWDEKGFEVTTPTQELSVGRGSSSSCLVPEYDPYVDFYFDFSNFNPKQCEDMRITWDTNYTAPLDVVALTPGPNGRVWRIYETSSSRTSGTDWTVDVRGGDKFAVVIFDEGPLGNGGSSAFITVDGSSDSSCLPAPKPTTVPVGATQTNTVQVTQVVTQSSSPPSSSGASSASSSSSNAGTIGGAVGGTLGGLALIALVALILVYRRRKQQVEDPSHPRTDVWKGYREKPVLLGGTGSANGGSGTDTRYNTSSPSTASALKGLFGVGTLLSQDGQQRRVSRRMSSNAALPFLSASNNRSSILSTGRLSPHHDDHYHHQNPGTSATSQMGDISRRPSSRDLETDYELSPYMFPTTPANVSEFDGTTPSPNEPLPISHSASGMSESSSPSLYPPGAVTNSRRLSVNNHRHSANWDSNDQLTNQRHSAFFSSQQEGISHQQRPCPSAWGGPQIPPQALHGPPASDSTRASLGNTTTTPTTTTASTTMTNLGAPQLPPLRLVDADVGGQAQDDDGGDFLSTERQLPGSLAPPLDPSTTTTTTGSTPTTTTTTPARPMPPSEKARLRNQQRLNNERPATIVRHYDAGIVEETEGQPPGPGGFIHLPPSYEEASVASPVTPGRRTSLSHSQATDTPTYPSTPRQRPTPPPPPPLPPASSYPDRRDRPTID